MTVSNYDYCHVLKRHVFLSSWWVSLILNRCTMWRHLTLCYDEPLRTSGFPLFCMFVILTSYDRRWSSLVHTITHFRPLFTDVLASCFEIPTHCIHSLQPCVNKQIIELEHTTIVVVCHFQSSTSLLLHLAFDRSSVVKGTDKLDTIHSRSTESNFWEFYT